MSCEQVQIQCLENKQPIFKEFCKIHSLKNGVDYKIFEIVADEVSFCGDKTGGGNSTQYVENAEEAEYFGVNDDELPF